MKEDEFYIGWQEEASNSQANWIKQKVWIGALVVPLLALALVLAQQPFASSTFELGKEVQLTGILLKSPVPMLQVDHGFDQEGSPVVQTILLVAFGKHGAEAIISEAEQQSGKDLQHTIVDLKGSLIYHDGKTLLEVKELLATPNLQRAMKPSGIRIVGNGTLIGEITDPKCLFGVMKPGLGKPHRSCASLCIAGGIPPVLRVLSEDDVASYYILATEDGAPINQRILPFVGDQVILCGTVKTIGDWNVLYVRDEIPIRRLPKEMDGGIPLCVS